MSGQQTRLRTHWRAGGSGPALILLNGWSASGITWPTAWLRDLHRSFRVIRVDNRGSGWSRFAEMPFTMADLAGDVLDVMDDAEAETATIFGLSMGGMIAQETAIRAPERLTGLVLAATAPPMPGYKPRSGSAFAMSLLRPPAFREPLDSYFRKVWTLATADGSTVVAMAQNTASARAPAQAIAAVLFDWDCTLIDSRAALLGAWHESTEAVIGRRFPATPAEEQVIFTLPGAQIWPELTKDGAKREALIERFQQAYQRTAENVRAFAGVPEALRSLREAGIATAVVTSKARRRFSLDAQRASLEELIDVAVCAEDADAPKPDPGPVLKAVEMLGVRAAQAVMAGDTVVDVTAGLRAGTEVVGVAWGASTEDQLRAAGARVVIHKPGQLVALVLKGHDDAKGTTS